MRAARRIAFLLIAALWPLGGGSVPAAAAGETVVVATSPNDSGAEVYYALDKGFFKEAGLDVELRSISNAALIHAGLLAGSVDIGSVSVPAAAIGHEKGLPYVLIAPGAIYSSKATTSALVVAKNSPIATAADLTGKTVGVRDLQNPGTVACDAWVDQNGGNSKSLKFVEVPDFEAEAAVVQGRIDAASIADPFLHDALQRGGVRVLASTYNAIANEFMIGAWFTTQSYAKSHPEIVRKFNAVIIKTAKWANSHQAESAQILAKYAKVVIAPGMSRVTYAERLDPAQVQPFINAGAKYGMLKAPFPARELLPQ